MVLAAEMWYELIRDYNHWIFEGVHDLIQFGILALIARSWVKIHDRKNHKHIHCEDVHGETSEFWKDLAEDLKNPELLKAYIDESIRVATIDQQVNDEQEIITQIHGTWNQKTNVFTPQDLGE